MTLRYGKKGEDAWTTELKEELTKLGLDATTFPIFHVYEDGKRKQSKPDIEIVKGGVSVGSAKLGNGQIIEALSTAQEYSIKLQNAEELSDTTLNEVFAIVYPNNRKEKFYLFVLSKPGRAQMKIYKLKTLKLLAFNINRILIGKEDELDEEPIANTAPRVLYNASHELAKTIEDVDPDTLEEVFGGHQFFENVLATRLKGKERMETLKLGVAFLFINQILFYLLLSKSSINEKSSHYYPEILEKDMDKPERFQNYYFKKVRDLNYEPIYGFPVANLFCNKYAKIASRDIIKAIIALAPN